MKDRWEMLRVFAEETGQSLVELALFFPVLLIILAGIVEVSNLLNTQNKITTAARMGAGFGANNVDENDVANWSDPSSRAYDMGRVAVNAITATLETDPEFWDVFSIYAEVKKDDPDNSFITHTQVFGNNKVITWNEWVNQDFEEIKQEILAEINTWPDNSDILPVVASVAYHEVDAILGIPVLQWTGLTPIRSLTVMRLSDQVQQAFDSCPLLPITVRLDQYSLYPDNWEDETPPDSDFYMYPSGVTTDTSMIPIYPEEIDGIPQTRWDYPDNEPSYVLQDLITTTVPLDYFLTNGSVFTDNIPGISLEDAIVGYPDAENQGVRLIYLARETGPDGSFGWLDWTASSGSETDLATSLTWPGDFTSTYPFGLANDPDVTIGDPPFDHPACYDSENGVETCDGVLEIGEWVRTSTGNINSDPVQEQLQCYVDMAADAKGKGGSFKAECIYTPKVVLLVYRSVVEAKDGKGQPGFNAWYRVAEFIEVRLIGYSFGNQPEDRWLLFEYLGVANECVPGR